MLERCEYCKKVYRKAQLKKHLRECRQYKLHRKRGLNNKQEIASSEELILQNKIEKPKEKTNNPKGKKK